MFSRLTVCLCRKIAMMIASPTAASAAATVMTKTTNTCPAIPYTLLNATNVRFTAFSMSSTHMKITIALRRVSTPIAPIENRTADSASDSASIDLSPAPDHDSADDRDEQQNACQLERKQILVEQRLRHTAYRAEITNSLRVVSGARDERLRHALAGERGHLRQQCEPKERRCELPPLPSNVGDLGRLPEVQQHDDEQEDHHDRAGVDEHLNDADELGLEHDVEPVSYTHLRAHETPEHLVC